MDQALLVRCDGRSLAVVGKKEPNHVGPSMKKLLQLMAADGSSEESRRELLRSREGHESFWERRGIDREQVLARIGVGQNDPEFGHLREFEWLRKDASLRQNAKLRGKMKVEDYIEAGYHLDTSANFFSLDGGKNKPFSGVQVTGFNGGNPILQPLRVTQQHWAHLSGANHRERMGRRRAGRTGAGGPQRQLRKAEQQERERQWEYQAGGDAPAHPPQPPMVPLREHLDEASTRLERDAGNLRVGLKLVQMLRRAADAVNARQDVVIFLGWDFSGRGSGSRGARCFNESTALRILQDHFLVVLVPEQYTSQLCPKCFNRMKFASNRSYRRKECCNPICQIQKGDGGSAVNFRCDRDTAAAINFIHIIRYMHAHNGVRPPVFTHEWQQQDTASTAC